jgi:hypothetical protein
MSEERRAVIEAALRSWYTQSAGEKWPDQADQIEHAVAAWERSREPTDAEIERIRRDTRAVLDPPPGHATSFDPLTVRLARAADDLCMALRAARDVRENTE